MKMRLDRHKPRVQAGFRPVEEIAKEFDCLVDETRKYYAGKLKGVISRTDCFEAIVHYVWKLVDSKQISVSDVYEME